MEAMLYMTTGFLDRHDDDIMLETALCKVFCSEMGYRVVNDALQIMGGESYMTENEVERIWRDSRINIIVEGANEVMHSFIFAYGSKQLGEWMLGLRKAPFRQIGKAMGIGAELYLGVRKPAPSIVKLHPRLAGHARTLQELVREFSHQVKLMFKEHEDKLVTAQTIQARLANAVLWIHALTCSLSKLDRNLRNGLDGEALEYELAVVDHIAAMTIEENERSLQALRVNTDAPMFKAAAAALKRLDGFPNADYVISEKTPDASAFGTGKQPKQEAIPQFGSGSVFHGVKVTV
jgi:hypothetical protein